MTKHKKCLSTNVLSDPKQGNALSKAGWGGNLDHLFSTFTRQVNLFGTKANATAPPGAGACQVRQTGLN